jgi:Uma2 family endonuclease
VNDRSLGRVLFVGLRVQVDDTKFREPDIVFRHKDRKFDVQDRYWDGADLVVEIVSQDPASRQRDLVTKRIDYAAAGIREYWIVDPFENRVTVLALEGNTYAPLGEFAPGDHAPSRVLDGFYLDVAATFDAAEEFKRDRK